jgi:alpha-ketoglutarate-dependent 2,4-dichlorophenoxyacetate dioxygenase
VISLTPVTSEFVAVIGDVDLSAPLSDATFAAIDAAFNRYAVLVFHGQPLTESQQNSFANRFGPLGVPIAPFRPDNTQRLVRPESADISNVDEHGRVLTEAGDARLLINRANALWHTDSTFKRTPAKMSMLCAQSVVPAGGETEFADMRAAWDALPAARKAQLESLVAEHDYFHSRLKVGLDPNTISPERRALLPPVPQVLVRTHPVSGRKSLYLASHIKRIYGMGEAESQRLVEELTAHATQPAFERAHRWSVDDVVLWDNRCTMHRGRPHDPSMPRVMRRATAMDIGPSVPTEWRPAASRPAVSNHIG